MQHAKAPAVFEAVQLYTCERIERASESNQSAVSRKKIAPSSSIVSALQACVSKLQELCKEGSCPEDLLRTSHIDEPVS